MDVSSPALKSEKRAMPIIISCTPIPHTQAIIEKKNIVLYFNPLRLVTSAQAALFVRYHYAATVTPIVVAVGTVVMVLADSIP